MSNPGRHLEARSIRCWLSQLQPLSDLVNAALMDHERTISIDEKTYREA